MSEGKLILLALLACLAGMAACALTIDVHWRQVFGQRPQARLPALRVIGGILFAAAFWLCATANPVSMAILVWTMLLTVSAALIAALLTLRAHMTRSKL